MPDPTQGESSHAFTVENPDTSKGIVDTLRKIKIHQTMSNPERFLKKRTFQSWLQVKKSFSSFASKQV